MLSGNKRERVAVARVLEPSLLDGFNTIAPDILDADGVVIAYPTYWYSFPGQIKNVIDKMYSFCVTEKDIKAKKCGLICCCEEDELDVMDGISKPLDRTPESSLASKTWRKY